MIVPAGAGRESFPMNEEDPKPGPEARQSGPMNALCGVAMKTLCPALPIHPKFFFAIHPDRSIGHHCDNRLRCSAGLPAGCNADVLVRVRIFRAPRAPFRSQYQGEAV
jgi:hypothetical protein